MTAKSDRWGEPRNWDPTPYNNIVHDLKQLEARLKGETAMSNDLKASDLAQFIGTEHWYQHGLVKRVQFTDGVKYMAEHGGAYWLIDYIACHQLEKEFKAQPFQVWTLKTTGETPSRAVLKVDDGNDNVFHTHQINFTDFPLAEIKLYFTDDVILLPSEY